MYTSQPCGAPSGASPVPTALVTAATSAAQSTVSSGGTLQDAMTAVQNAITQFFQSKPAQVLNSTGAAAPIANQANASAYATTAAYTAACKALNNRRMANAQNGFNRLMERRSSDFAGSRIQMGEFNNPQVGGRQIQIGKRSCSLNGQAPRIVPVTSEFSYAPAPSPLVAAPIVPVPAIPPAGTPAQADCETGNICIDIRNGCVLSSQVTPAQLLACAAAGYVGNLNKYPAIAAAGGARGGMFLGAPLPNPPQYNIGMGALRRRPARPMRRVA